MLNKKTFELEIVFPMELMLDGTSYILKQKQKAPPFSKQKNKIDSISQSISISPMYSYPQELVQSLYSQWFIQEINNLKKKVKK